MTNHKNQKNIIIAAIAIGSLILLGAIVWIATAPNEKATVSQAQEISDILKKEGVKIDYIEAKRQGYLIQYPAESAADRFDDAMLYDWAMIYGTAAGYDCDKVTIVTTLDNEPVHQQTATCNEVRALARGVITEAEFWTLVEHETP